MNNENVNNEPVKSGQSVGSLFSVLLFFLFILCMVTVMVIGATVYRNIVKGMDENFNNRTAVSYITNKVRQYDRDDQIDIIDMDGQSVLELKDEFDGLKYHTLIYCNDGQIMELFKAVGDELSLSDGIPIIAAKGADFVFEKEHLISILVEGAEGTNQTFVYLRSGGKDE